MSVLETVHIYNIMCVEVLYIYVLIYFVTIRELKMDSIFRSPAWRKQAIWNDSSPPVKRLISSVFISVSSCLRSSSYSPDWIALCSPKLKKEKKKLKGVIPGPSLFSAYQLSCITQWFPGGTAGWVPFYFPAVFGLCHTLRSLPVPRPPLSCAGVEPRASCLTGGSAQKYQQRGRKASTRG